MATCGGCFECAWWRAYNDGEGDPIEPCPRLLRLSDQEVGDA